MWFESRGDQYSLNCESTESAAAPNGNDATIKQGPDAIFLVLIHPLADEDSGVELATVFVFFFLYGFESPLKDNLDAFIFKFLFEIQMMI
jgi:hypothetical protein